MKAKLVLIAAALFAAGLVSAAPGGAWAAPAARVLPSAPPPGDDALIDEGEPPPGAVIDDDLPPDAVIDPRRGSGSSVAPLDLSKPRSEEPSGPPVDFTLSARLAQGLADLTGGLVWRIFGEREGADGKLPLLAEIPGGGVTLKLAPGSYLVHAAYGRAGAIKRIVVPPNGGREDFALNAGGLRLRAVVGKDTPIPANQLYFDIYVDNSEDGERALVVAHVPAGRVLRLTAGSYYVVSKYGNDNATVRATIKVEAGKMTDATLFHKAARVTLKLVAERGGEALANTQWSIQSPGGEPILESTGAYQQAILAAGQYQAVAKHDGKTYRTTFIVQNDLNRDVEVLAK